MNWFELTLSKGPMLVYKRPDRNDDPVDVTDRAVEYLFSLIRLEDNVTLADVLQLLDNPVMRAVFRHEYVNELLEEASMGPVEKNELAFEKLESIELNQLWNFDSATKEFTSVGKFGVSGKSHLLTEDVKEGGSVLYKAGERINWGISMTSVRELLNIPVRVQSAVQICEEDPFAKRFGHAIQSGVNHQITLGTLIQSLLWELSWHGTRAERDTRKAELLASLADLHAGTPRTVPYTWGTFGHLPISEIYPRFFEVASNPDTQAFERAIEELEDGQSAQAGLDQVFAGKHRLKVEYARFKGRDLRVAIDEAREPKDEPSQLLDQYNPSLAYAEEIKDWDNMVPVGREFGSPDFERLMDEDAKAFEANLTSLIEECSRTETAKQAPKADEFLQHAINVHTAIRELGQDVSVSLAAAVWEHYSASLAASWMSGAETVKSAKMTLFSYCSGQPKSWTSYADSKIPISNTFTLAALVERKQLGGQNPTQERTHKQVIVLRKDLNMRKGKMVAQGAHASMKAVIDTGSIEQTDGRRSLIIPLENDSVEPWLFGKYAKVTVSVDSETELITLHKEVLARGLVCALIQDAGLTEFGGVPTYTALAIGPHRSEVFEDLTSQLKLL